LTRLCSSSGRTAAAFGFFAFLTSALGGGEGAASAACTGGMIGWQTPSTRVKPSAQRSLSFSRRSPRVFSVFLELSWVVVSERLLSAWLARAAPEKAPSAHSPFIN
jgi:hypothetical protein